MIVPKNYARFHLSQLRAMPRPATYLAELRACAVRIRGRLWEFDEDSPCFKRLRAKYREYVPTPEDWFRVELFRADEKAKRDEFTRRLWGELHKRALSLAQVDPVTEGKWLEAFDARVPCGDCRRGWRTIIEQTPPDLSSPAAYFAWTVAAHNAVNRHIGKPEFTVEQARARWR